ncbi:UNVERIFIED_ORG: peroxiredoxin [Arthrobacter sp. UYEF2]
MSQRLTAGETAPAFNLADSTGALHSLAEVLGISPDPIASWPSSPAGRS